MAKRPRRSLLLRQKLENSQDTNAILQIDTNRHIDNQKSSLYVILEQIFHMSTHRRAPAGKASGPPPPGK